MAIEYFNAGNALSQGFQVGNQIAQARAARQQQNALAQGMVPTNYGTMQQGVSVPIMGVPVQMSPQQALEFQQAQQDRAAELALRPTQQAQAEADLSKTQADTRKIAAETAAAEAERRSKEQNDADLMESARVYSALNAAAARGDRDAWEDLMLDHMDVIKENQLPLHFIGWDNRGVVLETLLGTIDGLTAVGGYEGMSLDPMADRAALRGETQGSAYDDMSADDQEIYRLQEINVPRDVAVKLNAGAFKTMTDQGTGETVIVDVTSGQPVMRLDADTGRVINEIMSQPGQAAPAQPQQQPAPPRQPEQPSLTFDDSIPTGGESAFGLRGAGASAVNTVGDALGLGQAFPNAAEQRNFFRNFEEELLVNFAQSYGRQPSVALMERLRALAPNVGNILEGPEQAVGELKVTRRRFQRELENATDRVDGRMRQGEREELRAQIRGLESIIGAIDEGLVRLGAQPQGTTSGGSVPQSFIEGTGELPEGITPQDVWNQLSDEDKKLWQN